MQGHAWHVTLLISATLVHLLAGYALAWLYGKAFKLPVADKITFFGMKNS
jgi:predicted Na+-dependent transporter